MTRHQVLSTLTASLLFALLFVTEAAKGKATNRAEGRISAVDRSRMTVTIRGVSYQVITAWISLYAQRGHGLRLSCFARNSDY